MAFLDHNRTALADALPAFQPQDRAFPWACSICFHTVALAVAAVLLRELPQAPTPMSRLDILLSDSQSETSQAASSDSQSSADAAAPLETPTFTEDSVPAVPASSAIQSASMEMPEQHRLSEPSIDQQPIQRVNPADQAQRPTEVSPVASDPAPIESPAPIERQIEAVDPMTESYRAAAAAPDEPTAKTIQDHEDRSSQAPPELSQNPAEAIASNAPLTPHNGEASSHLTDLASAVDSPTGSSGSPTASSTETIAVNHPTITRGVPSKPHYGWLMELLRRRIISLQAYPRLARTHGWEGVVVVKATINSDGKLVDAAVTKSSGYGDLDEDALKLMHRVCPIHLSQDLGKSQIAVLIPIRYRLDALE